MMRYISFGRRMIKTLALLFASLGVCLHIYSTYDSILLACLLYVAIGVINMVSIAVLWPHALAHEPSRTNQAHAQ